MKEVIDFIKKNSKSKRGKAIWFFVGFAFLLLILMIIARTSAHYPLEKQLEDIRNANNKENGANIADLLKLNYQYTYTINHDNNILKITGKMTESAEEFSCINGKTTTKYFRNDSGLYQYSSNSLWIKDSNECSKFYKFYNLAYINDLLEEATLDHNTSYKDGKVEIYLLISVNTINKILDNKTTDYSDEPSTIMISYDENGVINGISYDLSNYCKTMKLCKKNLLIDLKFTDIGKVEKIDNPIE